jgi:hypothetical protein
VNDFVFGIATDEGRQIELLFVIIRDSEEKIGECENNGKKKSRPLSF